MLIPIFQSFAVVFVLFCGAGAGAKGQVGEDQVLGVLLDISDIRQGLENDLPKWEALYVSFSMTLKNLASLQLRSDAPLIFNEASVVLLKTLLVDVAPLVMSQRLRQFTERAEFDGTLNQLEGIMWELLDGHLKGELRGALQTLYPALIRAVVEHDRGVKGELIALHLHHQSQSLRNLAREWGLPASDVLRWKISGFLREQMGRWSPTTRTKINRPMLTALALTALGRYLRQSIQLGLCPRALEKN